MKCIDCKFLDLQSAPKMSPLGFGVCTQQKLAGVFESIVHERECRDFKPAAMDVIDKRVSWNKKQEE